MTKTKTTTKTKTAPKRDRSAEIMKRYPHIQKVTAIGDSGKPTRILIECTEEDCNTTREIATQDAFQVKRCGPCQREFAKRARRKTPVEAKPTKVKTQKSKTKTQKPKTKRSTGRRAGRTTAVAA